MYGGNVELGSLNTMIFVVFIFAIQGLRIFWKKCSIDKWKSQTSNKQLLELLGINRSKNQIGGLLLSTGGMVTAILHAPFTILLNALLNNVDADAIYFVTGITPPLLLIFGYIEGHHANLELYKIHGDIGWFDKSFVRPCTIGSVVLASLYSLATISELVVAPILFFGFLLLTIGLVKLVMKSQMKSYDKQRQEKQKINTD